MPTYEYVCRECGQHLEVVQSFSDDPLDTCEHCGGPLRKVFSAAGIIFKGSGYYVTDTRAARSGGSSSSSDADTTSSEGTSGSDSSSSSGDKNSSGSSTGAGSGGANGSQRA